MEILTSIARAGADLIITYHAREAARWAIRGLLPKCPIGITLMLSNTLAFRWLSPIPFTLM